MKIRREGWDLGGRVGVGWRGKELRVLNHRRANKPQEPEVETSCALKEVAGGWDISLVKK